MSDTSSLNSQIEEEKQPFHAPDANDDASNLRPSNSSNEDSVAKGAVIALETSREETGVYTLLISFISSWLSVAAMLSLIFGGCCSNVYALESIIKAEPASGTLLTFVQFLFVAVTGYISQFDRTQAPFFLTPNKVPVKRWLVNILLFYSINVMNNHAFSYDISVPVHIILRSGGSITTILAGYLWGKRYSRIQITSVVFLTIGVITAAYSDAQSKGRTTGDDDHSDFSMGLIILFVAQVLSAIMGIYTEETYKMYGPQWRENLFYSHILSLPLFLPFMPNLIDQFRRLLNSPPMTLSVPSIIVKNMGADIPVEALSIALPNQIVHLVLNVLTQYACIRGVNLLAAASTALTVTIVLNIRKLVSLLLSIWLFGNKLAVGTLVGAVVVFGSGALYSLDSSGRRKSAPTTAPTEDQATKFAPQDETQAGQKKMS